MKTKIIIVGALFAFAGACHGAGSFILASPEKAATVVLAKDCEPSSRLAAEELTNSVFRICGKQVKVEVEVEGGILSAPATRDASGTVLIGTMEKFPGEIPEAIAKRLNGTDNLEAGVAATDGKTLWIVGKTEVAELYAMYHFLESKMDVRWFQAPVPEDPGDYYPKSETIEIAPFAELRKPKFRIRRLDKCGAVVSHLAAKGKMTAVRNGYQIFPGADGDYTNPKSKSYAFFSPRLPRRSVSFGGGHGTFAYPVPAKTYFKDHPEYFALVDGKRVSEGWQYCFSNPDLLNLTADYVIDRLDRHQGNGQYLFGMVDVTHGWCECDNCRAWDPVPANGTATPNVSTRFNLAVKKMTERIWTKWPKADLSLWAYHTYRQLPVGVRQDPRLKIQFCDHGRCYGHHFDDPNCQRNVDMLALMKKWLAVSPQLYTYEYYNCSHNTYDCHELDEAHDLRFYASLGVMGWKNEASFSDSYFWPPKPKGEYDPRRDHFPSQWQWLYTTGHLLWDPYQDEQAIIDDAESKYYGAAYPAMRKYHALRRKLWSNSNICMGYPWGDPRRPTLLNVPGAKEELLGCLDEAEKLAAGDAVRLFRVGRDRKWLKMYWIEPNDKIREKAGKAYKAIRAKTPVVIDGKGDEGAWAGAFYATEFRRANCRESTPLPAELATTVGILYDDEALYFLINAKEPKMNAIRPATGGEAWNGDGAELFLYPPAIDNRVYHVAVTPGGLVTAATHPGGRVANAFGLKAKCVKGKDGWTIEIRLPVAKIHPLKNGETWKVNFARNRGGLNYATDGAYFDTSNYRPMEIGSPYLKNGSFADTDKDGNLVEWALVGKDSRLEPSGSGHVVHLKGRMYQCMAGGALGQRLEPRKFAYSIEAKGPGKLNVGVYRYVDTVDPKAKYGYTRKNLPSKRIRSFDLTEKMARYTGEYTIPAGEWNAIEVQSDDGITVSSVAVDPLAPRR